MSERGALSAAILEHFRRPRNHRKLDSPSAVGAASNASCGDRIVVALTVDGDGIIRDAAFQGEACSVAIAAASVLTERVRGDTLDAASRVRADEITKSLGGVPEGRHRCASLAPAALADALAAVAATRVEMDGVAGLVLAAGNATRFGGSKLTELLDGVPVVRSAVSRLLDARLARVAVVVGGPHAGEVRRALGGLSVELVERDGDGGIGDSLAAGVRSLAADPAVRAVVVALGDQPHIDPAVVSELVRALRGTMRQIAVPVYRGQRGHPVVFAREMFAALMGCTGDRGAAVLIESSPDAVAKVEVDAALPRDVDTRAALAKMRADSTIG